MYDEDKAQKAIKFISKLRQTKGRWAGHTFGLLDWQIKRIIKPLFGEIRPDGTRQYRTCYVEVPRKQGKSTLASAIALYMLCADGERGGEVYGAAVDRDQANIVFNAAAEMVRRTEGLAGVLKVIDSQKRIIYPKTGSFYRAIPSDAAGSHGFNASAVILDEAHAQPNRDLYDVLVTSVGARTQPLIFVITTAGYDKESICWELHEYADKVNRKVIDDPSFLPVLYSADDSDDWTDPATWHKANPSLGQTVGEDYLAQECKHAQEVPAYENTFRRLHLCQWTAQETRWLPLEKWDACTAELPGLEHQACYGGLDLSTTTDLSAFALVFPDGGGGWQTLTWLWMPEESMRLRERRDGVPYSLWVREGWIEATPGNVIDYEYIEAQVLKLAEQYDVREIGYDPWNATGLVLSLQDKGLTMVPVRQGFASLSAPSKAFERAVLDGTLRHGPNPVMRWMVDNVTVASDPAGNIKPVKPDRGKSAKRIDGVVATIIALDRATRNAQGGGADNAVMVW